MRWMVSGMQGILAVGLVAMPALTGCVPAGYVYDGTPYAQGGAYGYPATPPYYGYAEYYGRTYYPPRVIYVDHDHRGDDCRHESHGNWRSHNGRDGHGDDRHGNGDARHERDRPDGDGARPPADRRPPSGPAPGRAPPGVAPSGTPPGRNPCASRQACGSAGAAVGSEVASSRHARRTQARPDDDRQPSDLRALD
jgi:hypothetical protein